ncbi:MAG: hypothetical protein H0V71_12145 [Chloroflexi bacterium]|nr:hypothetical protein [Chloroflexota bacterium]
MDFYAVDSWLRADPATLEELAADDLVVVIRYFGFPCAGDVVARAQHEGAWILDDACQALLSERPDDRQLTLYSPRKFIGVPDGGILQIPTGIELADTAFDAAPSRWWKVSMQASRGRRRFDDGVGDRSWFTAFQESEARSPVEPYAMSGVTDTLLRGALPWSDIAQRRIENFATLLERLEAWALFGHRPAGVVPLGFPIRVPDRERVLARLLANDIYPPVHWPVPADVPRRFADSRRLASEILTLPCDQRYVRSEMERVAALTLDALGR